MKKPFHACGHGSKREVENLAAIHEEVIGATNIALGVLGFDGCLPGMGLSKAAGGHNQVFRSLAIGAVHERSDIREIRFRSANLVVVMRRHRRRWFLQLEKILGMDESYCSCLRGISSKNVRADLCATMVLACPSP